MRVMLVSHAYPPDGVAGVERVSQMLATQLALLGDSVHVVARRWSQGASDELRPLREQLPGGAQLVRFAGGEYRHDQFLLHHEQIEHLFTQEIVAFSPDVVHINHLLGLSPRVVEIAHRHGAAVVLSLFDYYFLCPTYTLLQPHGVFCAGPDGGRECARTCFAHEGHSAGPRWERRFRYYQLLLQIADRVVFPSRAVRASFEQFIADPARLRTVPPGIPEELPQIEAAHPGREPPHELRLAFTGTVVHHKGTHVILEALRIAALPAVRLDVHGQAPDAAYLRRLHDQAALIPGLTFAVHGTYAPADLPVLMRDVDCTIVPSQWPETFGIVAREALALGLPVLVSRLGGLPDAIVEGHSGFSFAYDRPDELAAILRRLFEEDGLLGRLRAGARATTVTTAHQYAQAIRAIHAEACDDLARTGVTRWDMLEELDRLHQDLIESGFDAPPPRRRGRSRVTQRPDPS